jgi:hypothetical protein
MPATAPSENGPATLFPRRNMILFVSALITVVVGYVVLQRGAPEAASVLLVVGYCVLLPLALIV